MKRFVAATFLMLSWTVIASAQNEISRYDTTSSSPGYVTEDFSICGAPGGTMTMKVSFNPCPGQSNCYGGCGQNPIRFTINLIRDGSLLATHSFGSSVSWTNAIFTNVPVTTGTYWANIQVERRKTGCLCLCGWETVFTGSTLNVIHGLSTAAVPIVDINSHPLTPGTVPVINVCIDSIRMNAAKTSCETAYWIGAAECDSQGIRTFAYEWGVWTTGEAPDKIDLQKFAKQNSSGANYTGTDLTRQNTGLLGGKLPNGRERFYLVSFATGNPSWTPRTSLVTVDETCSGVPPVGNGMVAWWPFDEAGSGSATELLHGLTGIATGTGSVPGFVANARHFGSPTDRIDVASAPEINLGARDFSISTWVRTTQSSGSILDKGQSAGSTSAGSGAVGHRVVTSGLAGYELTLLAGKPVLRLIDSSGSSFVCPNAINDGQWHLVSVGVDRDSASGGRWYLDGANVGTFDPTARQGSLDSSATLKIGGGFVGDLDEMQIAGRALTASEIEDVFAAGPYGQCKSCPPAPPTAQLDLGFASHPTARVSVTGGDLGLGQDAVFAVSGATPFGLAFVTASFGFNAVSVPALQGATLVTVPPAILFTLPLDATGAISLPVKGIDAQIAVYLQLVLPDSSSTTNALELRFGGSG